MVDYIVDEFTEAMLSVGRGHSEAFRCLWGLSDTVHGAVRDIHRLKGKEIQSNPGPEVSDGH